MNKSYQPWTQDQAFLLPPSLRDWLAEDHLAWFILDVVSQLDLGAIERAIQSKDARGQRPYCWWLWKCAVIWRTALVN